MPVLYGVHVFFAASCTKITSLSGQLDSCNICKPARISVSFLAIFLLGWSHFVWHETQKVLCK